MIKCKECGYSNSDNATVCVECGCDISPKKNVLLESASEVNDVLEYERKLNKYKRTMRIEVSLLAIIIFVLSIGLFVNLKKSNYLKNRIDELTEESEEFENKYNIINEEHKALLDSEEYKEFLEANSKSSFIDSMNNEISNMESEIESLSVKIAELEGTYFNKLSEPIAFSAGEYICGIDFPAGRYRIYDGSSNFVVTGGSSFVNIILGNDPVLQVNEYIHYFEEGELVESRSSFKLQLIIE